MPCGSCICCGLGSRSCTVSCGSGSHCGNGGKPCCSRQARICARTAWLGLRTLSGNCWPVFGDVPCSSSQRVMAARSYVWPSDVNTGCSISSRVMQQRNSSGNSASVSAWLVFSPCPAWQERSAFTFSGRARMTPLPPSKVNIQRPEASSKAVSVPVQPLSSGRFARPLSTAGIPMDSGALALPLPLPLPLLLLLPPPLLFLSFPTECCFCGGMVPDMRGNIFRRSHTGQ
mmetsp:Transcript_107386/g.213191  ORF Transcript_107386/g.213191 Transcript_107386/m.213191 type:complete len:230 (-) Transcript_107386:309-998(-)